MNRFFRVFFALTLFLSNTLLHSQSNNGELSFENFLIDQDIPEIECFLFDKTGHMWVGTINGLFRYDGVSLDEFKHKPAYENTLTDNHVISLYEDRDGNLWIGTRNGLNIYDPETNTFKLIPGGFGDARLFENVSIRLIYEDRSGIIWIGASGLGLLKFDKNKGKFIRQYNMDLSKSLSSNHIKAIVEKENGEFWLGSDNGLILFNPENEEFIAYTETVEENGLPHRFIKAIIADKQGNLWIGTDGGLSFVNTSSQKLEFTNFYRSEDNNGLSDNFIKSLDFDHEGNIWIASDFGLNIFSPSTKTFRKFYFERNDPHSIAGNLCKKIVKDQYNRMWVATRFGTSKYEQHSIFFKHYDSHLLSSTDISAIKVGSPELIYLGTDNGINTYNPQTKTFNLGKKKQPTMHGKYITSIEKFDINNLVVGTTKGLYLLNTNTNKTQLFSTRVDRVAGNIINQGILCLALEKGKSLWVGTWGGIWKYDLTLGNNQAYLKYRKIQCLLIDSSDDIWVGTRTGVLRFDRNLDKFIDPFIDTNTHNAPNEIISINEFQEDIWIGTSKGLYRYSKDSNHLFKFTIKDGLPSEYIQGINGERGLWITTVNSLARLNSKEFEVFNELDGLSRSIFNPRTIASTMDHLYIGGNNGLYVINTPQKTLETNSFPIVLKKFYLGEKPVEVGSKQLPISVNSLDTITLEQDQNNIGFRFAQLNFTNPLRNKIDYMLEPIDRDWKRTDGSEIHISDLPVGLYQLKLRDRKDPNNKFLKQLTIIIQPPWWKTSRYNFFWFSALFLIIVVAYFVRTKTLKAQQKKLQNKVNERTNQLENKLRENQLLFNLSSNLIAPIELEVLLKNLIDTAVELIPNAQAGSIFLLDNNTNELEGKVSHLLPNEKIQQVRLKSGEGHGGKALALRKNILENHRQPNKELDDRLIRLGAQPLKSIIVVLLRTKEKILGTISVDNYETFNAFTKHDLEIIESLAANASIAIERVRISNELEKTNEQLIGANEKLKELDEYKESMTAMIVHDFKNSLNTVINFSEGKPTERRIKGIHQAGQFMLNMVMNILDVQKFENTQPNLNLQVCEVSDLIQSGSSQLTYLLEQKSINLNIEQSHDIAVNGDKDLLIRVMVNILSNAIKYSPLNGEIIIRITSENNSVQIAISDEGPGIPKDKLELIFDKYAQVEARKEGIARSTGIGLTFCKMVIDAHDGNIWAASTEGQGSTFYINMPLMHEIKSASTQNNHIPHGQKIALTSNERKKVAQSITELQKWEVFDFSEVMEIIERIDNNEPNIISWKKALMEALHNGNEKLYQDLVRV